MISIFTHIPDIRIDAYEVSGTEASVVDPGSEDSFLRSANTFIKIHYRRLVRTHSVYFTVDKIKGQIIILLQLSKFDCSIRLR